MFLVIDKCEQEISFFLQFFKLLNFFFPTEIEFQFFLPVKEKKVAWKNYKRWEFVSPPVPTDLRFQNIIKLLFPSTPNDGYEKLFFLRKFWKKLRTTYERLCWNSEKKERTKILSSEKKQRIWFYWVKVAKSIWSKTTTSIWKQNPNHYFFVLHTCAEWHFILVGPHSFISLFLTTNNKPML